MMDVAHIEHAMKFLKPGGRLVALCANGPRQQAKLRDGLVQRLGGTWENLPAGSFSEQGTGVNVAMLVVDAPAVATPEEAEVVMEEATERAADAMLAKLREEREARAQQQTKEKLEATRLEWVASSPSKFPLTHEQAGKDAAVIRERHRAEDAEEEPRKPAAPATPPAAPVKRAQPAWGYLTRGQR
jgi:hypothetical protein